MIYISEICMLGNFSCYCWHLLTLFQNSKLTFNKILSGTLSECQRVWIQIRTDILSVLIWVQLFVNVRSGQQKGLLARNELITVIRPFSCNIELINEVSAYYPITTHWLLTLWPLGNFSCFFLSSADFLKINLFVKFFLEYFLKQFGSRSGLTFCQAWSESKLFSIDFTSIDQ